MVSLFDQEIGTLLIYGHSWFFFFFNLNLPKVFKGNFISCSVYCLFFGQRCFYLGIQFVRFYLVLLLIEFNWKSPIGTFLDFPWHSDRRQSKKGLKKVNINTKFNQRIYTLLYIKKLGKLLYYFNFSNSSKTLFNNRHKIRLIIKKKAVIVRSVV